MSTILCDFFVGFLFYQDESCNLNNRSDEGQPEEHAGRCMWDSNTVLFDPEANIIVDKHIKPAPGLIDDRQHKCVAVLPQCPDFG